MEDDAEAFEAMCSTVLSGKEVSMTPVAGRVRLWEAVRDSCCTRSVWAHAGLT